MKNKPQWLLDAEAEIQKFEQTEWGKLTEKEFKRKEAASNAGKIGGAKGGKTSWANNRDRMLKISSNAGKIGGSKGGKTSWANDRDRMLKLASNAGKIGGSKGGKTTSAIKIECPHCGKTANPGNYAQYHGDKCKQIKEHVILNDYK